MVKAKYTTTEIKKIVRALVEILITNNIAVDKIILYGSYATGRPRNHSDIDIAVISPSFNGKKILEIQEELAKAFSKYLSIIEPVGYSSEDFRAAEPETLLGEIKKAGKILYAA
ncbi:MAG TPA: nucleotidyltransferase domain-containing protein [Nitrospirae bacterium]|nr:nucleotidyltransferase domain protein [bacterium BMS3Abin06]HDH12693.1 nucleotidyltransferase domain-containing protein [Nitrospirota bacterium]HDZ00002.1 nucleotidyltransferase domain-containing protein [Nitrospirota bacterium]